MLKCVRQSILMALLVGVPTGRTAAQAGASAPDTLHPAQPADTSEGQHNVLPVVEITSFLALLNAYDRVAYPNETKDGIKVFSSTFSSTWDHLRTQRWVYDPDPFNVNQFYHPYQGATMYGLARSSGHNFWTSLIHANVGSFMWKRAGETDPPSINDMITTEQAGSLLGEALYRMADLVLKDRVGPKPGQFHELAAALISPPGGVNRRLFGERFKAKLPDTEPATIWQLRFGATKDAIAHDYSAPSTLLQRDATAEFSMSYGLPGQRGGKAHRRHALARRRAREAAAAEVGIPPLCS